MTSQERTIYGSIAHDGRDRQKNISIVYGGDRDSYIHREGEKKSHSSRVSTAIIGSVLLFGCIGLISSRPSMWQQTEFQSLELEYVLNFRVFNDLYSDKPGEGYPFLRSSRLVEPYRESHFEVFFETNEGAVVSLSALRSTVLSPDFSGKDCQYSLALRRGGGPWDEFPNTIAAADWKPSHKLNENMTFSGMFPSPGNYEVNISCSAEGYSSIHMSDSVDCLYVRRELRKIADEEKEDFLDMFVLMHETPTEHGVKLYGKHYRSLTDFQIMHLRAAGARELDHIHDGLGAVTQHVAITSEFELSLQSLKPHLSVPFWDYTIDSAIMETTYGHADISSIIKYSELFTPNWFGRTDSKAHTVTEGRFGNMEIERNYNFSTRSPYGFLRAPWNINPNKYITRYHKICGSATYSPELTKWTVNLMWPTCDSHFRMTNSPEISSWYDWAWNITYLPHGPVHAWIGGVGGQCNEFDALLENGWIDDYQLLLLKHNAFIILKNAWRDFLIETPKLCSQDAPIESCMWKCVENISTQHHVKMGLAAFGDINTSSPYFDSIARKVYCDTPYWPGDHLEAASAAEASFWPIHPTLDRLLQYKDLVRPFTNGEWILDNETSTYCTNIIGCKGHHAYDLTYWKQVFQTSSGVYTTRHRTNIEVRDAVTPTGDYSVPYIYDFGWPHCEEVGVIFKTVSSSR